jgi:hypothetical protein
MSEPDYDLLMEFLIAEDRLCCIVNPMGKLYGKTICDDCFRKVRKCVTLITVDWNSVPVTGIIQWREK